MNRGGELQMKKRTMWLVVGMLLLVSTIAICEMMQVKQYSFTVTPDAEVTQELRNVQAVEIYNAGKNIRVAFNDVTTADGEAYWVIPDSAVGFERDGLNLQYLTLRLMGDTASDTAVVRVNIYHK